MLKAFKTRSWDMMPDGSINKEHTHTPITQLNERSADERRLTIFMMSGMFHNGRATDAARPMFSTRVIITLPASGGISLRLKKTGTSV